MQRQSRPLPSPLTVTEAASAPSFVAARGVARWRLGRHEHSGAVGLTGGVRRSRDEVLSQSRQLGTSGVAGTRSQQGWWTGLEWGRGPGKGI